MWGLKRGTDRRGQSNPIAVVLVFGLVIASTTIVVLAGGGAISSTQDQLDTASAENAMTQMDSQASLVALGASDSQTVSIDSPGSANYRVVDSGHITLYANGSEIINEQLGAVIYEGDSGTTVAYQGGGVWREDGDNSSVMVSPPEIHYRGETLTMPIVTLDGNDTLSNGAVFSFNSSTEVHPNETWTNPLPEGRTNVTIHSEYYRAWGTYFEDRTSGGVEYNHSANNVTLTLLTTREQTTVTSASSSLAANGKFIVQGKAGTSCGALLFSNSYNSSNTQDDYCTQEGAGETGNDGDIVYGSDVDISVGAGSSNFYGDVVSGGDVIISGTGCGGQPCVYGNITTLAGNSCVGGSCSDAIESTSGGSPRTVDSIATVPSINETINTTINEAKSENDNADTRPSSGNGYIDTSDNLQYNSSNAVELDSGTYYLTQINPSGDETVYLNTTEGDVNIIVQENIYLQRSGSSTGQIRVVNATTPNPGVANVYVGGTGGNSYNLKMDRNGNISNKGDDAPEFQLYGRGNFTAKIGSGQKNQPAVFVGAIYAPPGDNGPGRVDIDGGEVFGGVLTGTTTLDKGSIHYDKALQDTELVGGGTLPAVQYVHASVNRVNVTSKP